MSDEAWYEAEDCQWEDCDGEGCADCDGMVGKQYIKISFGSY